MGICGLKKLASQRLERRAEGSVFNISLSINKTTFFSKNTFFKLFYRLLPGFLYTFWWKGGAFSLT